MEATKTLVAKLRDMSKNAGEKAYERVRLARRILDDIDWVALPDGGGGNEDIAMDRLEAEYFGDLCGSCSLAKLLDILKEFPDVSHWEKRKYHLMDMWADVLAKRASEKRERPAYHRANRRAKMSDLADALETIDRLTKELAFVREKAEAQRRDSVEKINGLMRQIHDLQRQVHDLRQENAKLTGQVDELQRILDKFALVEA